MDIYSHQNCAVRLWMAFALVAIISKCALVNYK